MAIEFQCPCGAACRAEESKAGQLFHCEVCGLDIPVPAALGGAPSAAAGVAAATAPPAARPSAMEALRAEVGKPGAAADLVSQIRAAKAAGAGQAPPAAGEHLAEKAAADIIPTAEVVGEPAAAEGKSAMEALQADIGHKGDVNEMLAQLGGAKPGPGPGAAPGPAPGGPPGAGLAGPAAVAALAARPARSKTRLGEPAGLPKPPTGVARAAHHFKFKRVMWIPALAVAGLCAALGVWLLFPRSVPKPPDLDKIKEPEVVKDAQGEMWAIPRGTQAVARLDGTMGYRDEAGQEGAAKQIITDEAGRFWAVPPGKTVQVSKTGKMFYEDDTGYEVMAEPADDWVDIYRQLERNRTYHSGRQQGYLWFGGGLLAVGLVLAVLGIWMWIDVRTVRREEAAEAGKAGQAPAAAAGGPAPLGAPVALSSAAPPGASSAAPPGASPPVLTATEKPPGPQSAPGEPPANTTALD